MKIRLPRLLRSALLACMTVFSPLSITLSSATALIVATVPSIQAEELRYDSFADRNNIVNATKDDLVIIGMDGTGTSYFGASFETNAGIIRIDDWTINNGNSNTRFVFNSTIIGSGNIVDSWGLSSVNEYYFTGDMSEYSGDIQAGNTIGLTFGGHGDLTTSATGTGNIFSSAIGVETSADNGLGSASGTGDISSSGEHAITYNYTKAASILNSSISMTGSASLNFMGGAQYALKSDVSVAGRLNILDGSHLHLSADEKGNHSLSAGSLFMGDDTSLTIDAQQNVSITGSITIDGSASINNAGSLILGSSASITIAEGQNLNLSGSITLNNSSQIVNNGSLSLSEDFVFDLSQISTEQWVFNADDGNFSFQLIAGTNGLGSNSLTASQIVGLDDSLYDNMSVDSNGLLTFEYVEGTAFYKGGDLTWTNGEGGFVTPDGSADLIFANGAHVFFTEGTANVTLGSDIIAGSVTVSSGVNLTLTGGDFSLDAGTITLFGTSSLTLTDDVLTSDTLISGNSSIDATIHFNASDAETEFNYGSNLHNYQGNISISSGHLDLTHEGGFVLNDVTLSGNNASINFGSDASFDRLLVTDNDQTTSAYIGLSDGVKITISGGATTNQSGSYYRAIKSSAGSKAGYTIHLGEGAVLSDNVRLWQGQQTINITGQGRYEVSSLLMGYTAVNETVKFNIGSGATFVVVGETETNSYTNSFAMGGAPGVITEMNIDGTAIINSQLVFYAGTSSTINVNSGGVFVLNAGFKAYNHPGDASLFNINVAEGGELQVGNQSTDLDYKDHLTVSMATDTTLGSNGAEEETIIQHTINFEQGGTHNFKAAEGDTLLMKTAVNNDGTINIIGGGSVGFLASNEAKQINVNEQSTIKLTDGVALFANGGSLNLSSGSTLDMSAGGGNINGNLNLSDQSNLLYTQGVAGGTLGNGFDLNLDSGANFIVGFVDDYIGSFNQVLFKDLTAEQIESLGLSENFYNGMSGCLASDILGADSSWELAEGSVVYLDEEGNLVLNNLAKYAGWNDTGDGIWSSASENWVVDGESGTSSASRELHFGAEDSLNKDVTVSGNVSSSRVDILGDYSFNDGSITIDYALNIADGANVIINSKLTLDDADLNIGDNASLSMNNTTLTLKVDGDKFLNGSSDALFQIGENSSLDMSGSEIVIGPETSGVTGSLDISKFDGNILVLAEDGKVNLDDVNISFSGGLIDKYFTNARLENGVIVGEVNINSYNDVGETVNGSAGLNLLSKALIALNPQYQEKDDVATISSDDATSSSNSSALASVLDTLDAYKAAGNTAAADALGAAVAGASTTALGSAMMGDVQRQLKTIRNRTMAMGVDPTIVHDEMPYFNAWISAEGASSSVDPDGTHSGYSLNSYGASIGVDVDLTEKLSIGLAYSNLRGDLSADAVDNGSGTVDTSYGTLYARVHHKRWAHSFVATFGAADIEMDRSIATSTGSVHTKGSTSGSSMGLMYELGYTYALNEDASSCLQPVFNISYLKSQVDGYAETGSDIALTVGDQNLSTISIGVGGVYQALMGENIYNRSAVFTARAMFKFDAGDRASEADVMLTANSGVTERIKGAEYGAVGFELGLGITIPITEDVGAIFIEANTELRSGQNSFGGTIGYRFSF